MYGQTGHLGAAALLPVMAAHVHVAETVSE